MVQSVPCRTKTFNHRKRGPAREAGIKGERRQQSAARSGVGRCLAGAGFLLLTPETEAFIPVEADGRHACVRDGGSRPVTPADL
jgi:hypothetical protein